MKREFIPLPSQERLKEILDYNPDTGIFLWKKHRYKKLINSVAGNLQSIGYVRIGIDNEVYWAHRLAYLYMTGKQPPDFIDHIDRNRSNNSWKNLRSATRSNNQCNQISIKGSIGFPGVHRSGERYRTSISVGRKRIYLGYYDTPDEAYEVYMKAKKKYHGEFSCYK